MAKPGKKRSLQVRGEVDVEKYKGARALGGDDVTFELRAMKPSRPGTGVDANAQILCIICLICIVCFAATAEELGLTDLPALEK